MNYFVFKQKSLKLAFFSSLLLILSLTEIFLPNIVQGQSLEDQLNVTPRINLNLEVRSNADQEVNLGDQALQSGDRDQAISHWLEALRLYESIPDLYGIGKVSGYLAPVYLELGDFAAAENAMRRHLAVTRSRQDQQTMIRSLNNLGTLLLEMGRNLDEIESLFTEALEISQAVGDLAGQGLSLSNLGRLAYFEGYYVQAIEFYESAVNYRLDGNDILGQVNTLNNLGDAYQETDQYWKSINNYRLALVVAEGLGDLDSQYRAWEGLAESYGALGYHKTAFRFLNEWGNLAIATDNLDQQLNVTRLSAYFYWELRDQENALIFYQKAIDLARAIGADQEVALLKTQLSEVLYGNQY